MPLITRDFELGGQTRIFDVLAEIIHDTNTNLYFMVPHLTFRYTSKILFVRAYIQSGISKHATHFNIEKKFFVSNIHNITDIWKKV